MSKRRKVKPPQPDRVKIGLTLTGKPAVILPADATREELRRGRQTARAKGFELHKQVR